MYATKLQRNVKGIYPYLGFIRKNTKVSHFRPTYPWTISPNQLEINHEHSFWYFACFLGVVIHYFATKGYVTSNVRESGKGTVWYQLVVAFGPHRLFSWRFVGFEALRVARSHFQPAIFKITHLTIIFRFTLKRYTRFAPRSTMYHHVGRKIEKRRWLVVGYPSCCFCW